MLEKERERDERKMCPQDDHKNLVYKLQLYKINYLLL